MIKLSIITVVYNAEDTIEKTIGSVLGQTYRNIEYIIIDGKSSDGTMGVISKFREDISFVVSEPDAGIYDAMNKGVQLATGDIIAFLNSGDWYEKNTCSKVISYFKSNSIDILIGEANFIDKGNIVGVRNINFDIIETGMPCCHQAVFARKKLFDKLGSFDIKYKICADYDWLLRVYYSNARFQLVKDVFANCDANGVSFTMPIDRTVELRDISLKYAYLLDNHSLVKQIEDIYIRTLEMIERRSKYYNFIMENVERIEKLIGVSSCYVWGAGSDGQKCFRLLNLIGINVKGFIDTNRKDDKLLGCDVFLPSEVIGEEKICIASSKYEDEIYAQAIKIGVDSANILFYSKLIRDIGFGE